MEHHHNKNGSFDAADSNGGVALHQVFSLDVSEDKIRQEALKICQMYFGAEWDSLSFTDISLQRLSGMTNYVFKVSSVTDDNVCKVKPLLLRIHGSAGHQLVIESVTASILAERHFGPKLFGIFQEGRLEEFIESDRLTLAHLSDKEMSSKIARKMAQFHNLDIPVMKSQWLLMQTCSQYFSLLSRLKPNNSKQVDYKKIIDQFDHATEVQFMVEQLKKSKSPVVFCHNDVQEGNILLKKSDQDLLFIDYEYSCYNYRNFDIINHFLEWTADYDVPHPPFFSYDTSKFPSKQQQMHFLQVYFSSQSQLRSSHPHEDKAALNIDQECEQVISEIDLFSCYSHLLWLAWAICVQYHMDLVPTSSSSVDVESSFDYYFYAVERIRLYRESKKRLLQQQQNL